MNKPLPDLHSIPVASATLPERYIAAKAALAECQRVDECKDWADRMIALASYARQSQDEELENMAKRIHVRAIRRCGEILDEIEPKQGANQNIQDGDGPKVLTRGDAAEQAGLSERQAKTALRVAHVPKEEFEAAVEQENPASVTELAERGIKSKPKPLIDLEGRDPADFAFATAVMGALDRLAQFAKDAPAERVARGVLSHERERVTTLIATTLPWLTVLMSELERNQ